MIEINQDTEARAAEYRRAAEQAERDGLPATALAFRNMAWHVEREATAEFLREAR